MPNKISYLRAKQKHGFLSPDKNARSIKHMLLFGDVEVLFGDNSELCVFSAASAALFLHFRRIKLWLAY